MGLGLVVAVWVVRTVLCGHVVAFEALRCVATLRLAAPRYTSHRGDPQGFFSV